MADSLDILQGFPHRVNRTSSRESAPDPQPRNLLTRAGHVWGNEKLGLPLVSMIGNGLAMGQNYHRARCENRPDHAKPQNQVRHSLPKGGRVVTVCYFVAGMLK